MPLEEVIYVVSYGAHMHNPYHDVMHCKKVFQVSKKILAHYNETPSDELIWAAYFHDYDHTGGRHPDPINIDYAVNGFLKKFESVKKWNPDHDNINIDKVIHLIKLTQFVDGKFPIEPNTLEEQALRDADLSMWTLELDDAVNFTKGLYTEMLIHNKSLTKEEFWAKNIEFLTNAKLYTSYANEYRDLYLIDKLHQIGEIFLGD